MNAAQNTVSIGLAAMNALLNSGTLVFYSGTMPSSPETALSGNTALVTFTFAATAFAAPSYSAGYEQAAATFVASSVAPSSAGTAAFARAFKSDGTTVVADYTVGTSGTDIVIGNTSIQMGVNVSITSFLNKMPAS